MLAVSAGLCRAGDNVKRLGVTAIRCSAAPRRTALAQSPALDLQDAPERSCAHVHDDDPSSYAHANYHITITLAYHYSLDCSVQSRWPITIQVTNLVKRVRGHAAA